MKKPNNLPLPNLSLGTKLLFSIGIFVGLLIYAGTWYEVIRAVYWDLGDEAGGEILGVGLGILAAQDVDSFWRFFWIHAAGMLLLLLTSYLLFRKTSIRRRVKSLIAASAIFFALLDLTGWFYAPHCSSTNLYVGFVSVAAAIPLVILALMPLFQMWVYRRWQTQETKRVVIVGGGFAGLYVALGLNKALGYHKKLEITVIDKKNYFLFPPLLPSAAAGTIETRQVSYPFRRIFETTNIIFRRVEVTSIDPKAQVVKGVVEVNEDPETGRLMSQATEFKYDYLVLAPGSLTQTFNTKGVDRYAFFMRELNDAVILRNHVIDCFERAAALNSLEAQKELLNFIIVGAGPTGIETATEIYDLIHEVLLKRYPEIPKNFPEVRVVQSGDQILPGWHKTIVDMATKQLHKMMIHLELGTRVTDVGPSFARLKSGKIFSTRTVVWCAGVKPSDLLTRCGVEVHESGRIAINDDCRVKNFENFLVLGDAAYLVDKKSGNALPPLGQVAFQQGSHTARNVIRLLSGHETKPFKYFDFGGLVSVGEHYAAVNLMGVRLSGFIGWFIWRSLYLTKLVGASNKIRVMIDWTLDLLIERSISQIRDNPRPLALSANLVPDQDFKRSNASAGA